MQKCAPFRMKGAFSSRHEATLRLSAACSLDTAMLAARPRPGLYMLNEPILVKGIFQILRPFMAKKLSVRLAEWAVAQD